MADELTDEAKAEIAAAVKIVHEDRITRMLNERLPAPKPPEPDPTIDPKIPPAKPPVELPKKKGIWWGDRINDDEDPPKTEDPPKPPEGDPKT